MLEKSWAKVYFVECVFKIWVSTKAFRPDSITDNQPLSCKVLKSHFTLDYYLTTNDHRHHHHQQRWNTIIVSPSLTVWIILLYSCDYSFFASAP